jgi:hypothetical protein
MSSSPERGSSCISALPDAVSALIVSASNGDAEKVKMKHLVHGQVDALSPNLRTISLLCR